MHPCTGYFIMHPHVSLSPYILKPKYREFKSGLTNIVIPDKYICDKSIEQNSGLGEYYIHVKTLYNTYMFKCLRDFLEYITEIRDNNEIVLECILVQTITSTPGTPQTITFQAAWNINNICYCIGGGGNAGDNFFASGDIESGGGGGGGACGIGALTGFNPGNTTTCFVGGVAQSSWLAGTLISNAQVVGDHGVTAVTTTKGLGGLVANCVGNLNKYKGGDGGNGAHGTSTATQMCTGGGGGGAAGSTVAGSNGADGILALNSTNQLGGAGGNSDTATGGAAIAGPGNNGGNGTDFDASHGAGAGGSGGGYNTATPLISYPGGNGGNYGAGAGGPSSTPFTSNSGVGIQGIVALTWFPQGFSEFYQTM